MGGDGIGGRRLFLAPERVLAEAGTALVASRDREAIHRVAVRAALDLLGDPAGVTVALAVPAGDGHRVVAAAGDGRPVAAGDLPGGPGGLHLPLPGRDGPLGLLVVAGDRPVPAEARGALETLATQVALGLERAALTEELAVRAFHDPLTGLANRFLLRDRLDQAVAQTRRSGAPTALLLLDLDGFKQVNDSLGHELGDQVLVGVADRVLACVREVDTVGRLGGDELAVVLPEVTGSGDAVVVAEQIIEALKAPLQVDGHELVARVSIGVAITGRRGDRQEPDPAVLLRNADVAMHHAKALRTGGWELYQPIMHADAADRRLLEADLHQALERGELQVHYQPIVALDSLTMIGVEALARWCHPTRGMVSPAEFIPLAEETGLIGRIGHWVLEQACRQVAAWRSDLPDGQGLGLSVNLSPAELDAPDVVERVAATLEATGLPPGLLALELTEGMLARNPAAAGETLARLKRLGVRLAIDDFGTGFSSLAYLDRFPIDILKIDRSFVARLEDGPDATALADAVIRLGQALRLQTVAEGVETGRQLAALRRLGCRLGQGYLFGRPCEPGSLRALLGRTLPAPSAASVGTVATTP